MPSISLLDRDRKIEVRRCPSCAIPKRVLYIRGTDHGDHPEEMQGDKGHTDTPGPESEKATDNGKGVGTVRGRELLSLLIVSESKYRLITLDALVKCIIAAGGTIEARLTTYQLLTLQGCENSMSELQAFFYL